MCQHHHFQAVPSSSLSAPTFPGSILHSQQQHTEVVLQKQEVTRKSEVTAGPQDMVEPLWYLSLPAKGDYSS